MVGFLAASYTIVDLHLAAQKAFLNDSGMVVGTMYSEDGKGTNCFVWKEGKLQKLPDIEEIYAINAKGQMAVAASNGRKPGIWFNGKLQLIPTDPNYRAPIDLPAGIDDRGRITNIYSRGSEGIYGISHWPDDYKAGTSLWGDGSIGGLPPPRPGAVAPDGSIAGTRGYGLQFRKSDKALAWFWQPGKPELPIGDANHQATPTCISRNHVVGGYYDDEVSSQKPFLWSAGEFIPLPTPAGSYSGGIVNGVNDRGEAVGEAIWGTKDDSGTRTQDHAVLWKNGKMYMLDDLIPSDAKLEIKLALAINQDGTILVLATPKDTHWPNKTLLLKPTK